MDRTRGRQEEPKDPSTHHLASLLTRPYAVRLLLVGIREGPRLPGGSAVGSGGAARAHRDHLRRAPASDDQQCRGSLQAAPEEVRRGGGQPR